MEHAVLLFFHISITPGNWYVCVYACEDARVSAEMSNVHFVFIKLIKRSMQCTQKSMATFKRESLLMYYVPVSVLHARIPV